MSGLHRKLEQGVPLKSFGILLYGNNLALRDSILTNIPPKKAHDELISTISWSRKYDLIATGDFFGKIKLWKSRDLVPVEIEAICHDSAPTSLEIGETLPKTYIHSAEDGRLLKKISAPRFDIWTSCFLPQENQILTGSTEGGVGIWSTETGQKVQSAQKSEVPIMSVAASQDGRFLAVGTRKNTVYILDSSTLKTVGEFNSLAFSNDSKLLASCSDDMQTCLIDVSNLEKIAVFSTHRSWICSVKFCPDGTNIATCSCDNTVKLWSLNVRRCYCVFNEHTGSVRGIAYGGNNSENLASAGLDKTINVYNIK